MLKVLVMEKMRGKKGVECVRGWGWVGVVVEMVVAAAHKQLR